MKIDTLRTTEKTASAGREVAPKRTPVTRAEMRGAIRRALIEADGARPPEQLVDTLTAQASLETASGDRMFNFNFAGIKGCSPCGTTAVMKTHEVIDGHDVVIKDGFRAYRTIDDGARDFVRTMKDRFSGALAPAARGDVKGFAGALKRAHYYTASEADYARGLTSLMNAPAGVSAASARANTTFDASSLNASSASSNLSSSLTSSLSSSELGLSTSGLSRVSDALDMGRWLGSSSASSSSSSSRVYSASDDEDDF